MGLRIATNIESQAVQKNLGEAGEEIKDTVEQLSSGRRINKSADDVAGLAIATKLRAQNLGLRQAARNANDAIALIQTAEGGINEVSNILIRLRELTIQSASDTVSDLEREFLDNEYQELTEEVERISKSTVFNGWSLLDGGGERGGFIMEVQIGTYASEENIIQFFTDETNISREHIGIEDSGVLLQDDALFAIEQVDEAIDMVSEQRAKLGATQSRLMSTTNSLGSQIINQEHARSVIEDADIAHATSKMAALGIMKEVGVSTLTQAKNIPAAVLRLL
ncbi:MAG: flagellin FliC [Bacteriovoracaceae bacterium]|nr:flagellin FliC [Bacteriovoracaceae bacterium]